MVTQLALALVIFLRIFWWMILLDVILSWAPALGFRIRIPFLRELMDPCYKFVGSVLPTSFAGLNFGPAILMIAAVFAEGILRNVFPSVNAFF